MKKILSLLFVISVYTLVNVTCSQAKPVVLRAVTAWPSNYFSSAHFLESLERINKSAEGKFVIEYMGGPEVVPGRQQAEAVRKGVVDITFLAMAYTAGSAPEIHYGLLSPYNPMEERDKGILDFWNKIYADKLNAYCLGRFGWGMQFCFFMGKKEVSRPEFTGLKIRSSPALEPVIKNLGGARVGMSVKELYTAMDRGVIDGYGTAFIGTRDFALQEVTKYVIDHPFWYTDTRALMSLKKWNSLPEDLKQFINKVMAEEEKVNTDMVAKAIQQERIELEKAGLGFKKFSPSDAGSFYKTISKGGWEYATKHAPEHESKFRNLFSK